MTVQPGCQFIHKHRLLQMPPPLCVDASGPSGAAHEALLQRLGDGATVRPCRAAFQPQRSPPCRACRRQAAGRPRAACGAAGGAGAHPGREQLAGGIAMLAQALQQGRQPTSGCMVRPHALHAGSPAAADRTSVRSPPVQPLHHTDYDLPKDGAFLQADLSRDPTEQLEQAEK